MYAVKKQGFPEPPQDKLRDCLVQSCGGNAIYGSGPWCVVNVILDWDLLQGVWRSETLTGLYCYSCNHGIQVQPHDHVCHPLHDICLFCGQIFMFRVSNCSAIFDQNYYLTYLILSHLWIQLGWEVVYLTVCLQSVCVLNKMWIHSAVRPFNNSFDSMFSNGFPLHPVWVVDIITHA